jgi:hypothetical protein
VIKAALMSAVRVQRRERLRAEAAVLAKDPVDVAEIRAVQDDVDRLRASTGRAQAT